MSNRISEFDLQEAFLNLLNNLDLFFDGQRRHVRVLPLWGNEYRVLYYKNGTQCQAEGFFTGTSQDGEFLLEWAETPIGRKEYSTKHPLCQCMIASAQAA
jgi:hypothetical protein